MGRKPKKSRQMNIRVSDDLLTRIEYLSKGLNKTACVEEAIDLYLQQAKISMARVKKGEKTPARIRGEKQGLELLDLEFFNYNGKEVDVETFANPSLFNRYSPIDKAVAYRLYEEYLFFISGLKVG